MPQADVYGVDSPRVPSSPQRYSVIIALAILGLVAPAAADPVNLVPYSSIGPNVVDFEDLVGVPPPPLIAIFDGILESRDVRFAERFLGQTLSIVPPTGVPLAGPLDELSGVPSDPLTLQPGDPNKNLAVQTEGEPPNNALFPCGNLTCLLFAGRGEGALALIFPAPVSAFGFVASGGDPPGGDIVVQFFRADGTLIAVVTVLAELDPAVGRFGFLREGGIKDIAGVSIHTTDPGGLRYDDFVFGEVAKVLLAGRGNEPADPGTETTPVTEDVMAAARFPLGSTFFIQLAELEEETGTPMPIESVFTLEAASVTPAITDPTLFPDSVVIEFDRAAASEIKFFTAVHLGSVTLNITPTDSSMSPVSVEVTVTQPLRLGSSNNEVDERLFDLGHRRGIPPQLLKGQIRRESNFDPEAYRYEPLSVDLRYVSRGQNIRTERPFSLYRLETDDGLAQGTDIVPDDISPRSIYLIRRNGTRRRIEDSDEFVSALEIFRENDARHNWTEACRDCAELPRLRANPAVLDFTAQTPVAASYGLLQILYSTAIAPMSWPGAGEEGKRNPSLLFDTAANLEMGGGSLELGSDYLRKVFARANPSVSVTEPTFTGQAAFDAAFEHALNYYNHHGTIGPYGASVLNFSQQFEPIPSTSIFP